VAKRPRNPVITRGSTIEVGKANELALSVVINIFGLHTQIPHISVSSILKCRLAI
jgi:hypothetical protein